MRLNSAEADRLRTRFFEQAESGASVLLRRIVDGAAPTHVYLVGGAVRDLMLDTPILDIDLAIEGDAIAVTRQALPGAKLTTHARFGTASVRVDGVRIDIASTRSETYARPGALPAVATAGIECDLQRRDVSINAMALRLDGPPELLDPCGGADDIGRRSIRVLHDRSFVDDATRIFRAVRYAERLGFTLEPGTEMRLREGARWIETIGGARLRREIELMLGETASGRALEAAQAAGALSAIHPALLWHRENTASYVAAPMGVARLPFGFALLASTASVEESEAICDRLKLTRGEAAAVRGIAAMQGVAKTLRRPQAKPSGVALLLDRFPVASVAALAATATDAIAGQLALRYVEEWRHVKPLLSGRDLLEIGVPEGPQLHQGLQLIRAARLDGWATDRGDEQALALRFAKSIRDSGAATSDRQIHINGK